MPQFVSEHDLTRARADAAFRQQLMADSLERLLEALRLRRMRKADDPSPQTDRLMREGVDLAVQLADRLQAGMPGEGPRAA